MFKHIISKIKNVKGRVFGEVQPLASNPRTQLTTEKQTRRILDSVEHEGKINSLPLLYGVLIDVDNTLRIQAAAVVDSVLRSVKPARLPWVADLCRARAFFFGSADWSRKSIEELVPADLPEGMLLSLYGFASFHPNGYFREKAVHLLAKNHSGLELPYLIIRMNDWVEPVRKQAKKAVIARLSLDYASHFVVLLPLLQKLREWGRDNHAIIFSEITGLVTADRAALQKGLASPDVETKRISYRLASSSTVFSVPELFEMLLREPEPSVRSFALRQLAEKLTSNDIQTYASMLLHDPSASIRSQAIELYCRHFLSNAENILREFAIDVSLSVRQTARYYLKKLGMSDFAGFYRTMLSTSPEPSPGLILGIGEVGSGQDCLFLEGFLKRPESRIVKATIRSISTLAPENMMSLILPFISDIRPGVSKTAMKFLRNRSFELEAGSLSSVFSNSSVHHVRRNALQLLCSINRWDSIAFIIEACGQADTNLSQLGTNALKKWFSTGVHASDRPSSDQVKNAENALALYGGGFDQKTKRELLFHLK